jgi:hypothetical protein
MFRKESRDEVRIVVITSPDDREYYSDILTRDHFLGSSQVNRNTIIHVARRGREDIGILTWERAVRKRFSMRDRIVGWTESQRDERLKFCIENRRFYMFLNEQNYASHVMSQSLKRLSEDARREYGHEVLLAETFVDPERGHDGACYLASGWSNMGLTVGGKGPDTRSKKLYLIKPLKAEALAKLKAPELSASDLQNKRQKVLLLEQLDFRGLCNALDKVPEYRKNKGTFPLTPLLALIISAALGGNYTMSAISRWIGSLSREYLKSLKLRRHPSYAAIRRVIIGIDQDALTKHLAGWLQTQSKKMHIAPSLRVLSLDGKALRAASKAGSEDIHVLSLVDSIHHILLGQVKVDSKTNEITYAIPLLEAAGELDAETMVTADALHTQEKLADYVQKKTLSTSFPSKETSHRSRLPSSRPLKNYGRPRIVRSTRVMEE